MSIITLPLRFQLGRETDLVLRSSVQKIRRKQRLVMSFTLFIPMILAEVVLVSDPTNLDFVLSVSQLDISTISTFY